MFHRALLVRRSILGVAVTVVASLALAGGAEAQDWKPSQVTIVLPHGVGGGQDRQTRILGKVWEKHLGVPIVYENVKGGSGRKGYEYFLNKPADGTYVMSSNLASASIMYAQQKPDWKWKDAVYPAGVFAVDPGAYFVKADAPYGTLEEVIAGSKESPLSMGLAFWASPDNLLTHRVMDITGANFQVVPIGGGSDTVTAVLGGHVNVGYTKVSNILHAGDAMKILAVSMAKNPVPGVTNNAKTVSEVVGEGTLPVASYRAIVFHKEFVEKYPERASWLKETFEAAKDDAAYIEASGKAGVEPDLLVDMDHEELIETVAGYQNAFDRFGDIYANN